MKHLITTPILAVLLGLFVILPAQAQEADSLLLHGKRMMAAGLNTANLDQMREARALFERAANDDHRAALAHYYVARTDHNLANLLAQHDEGGAVDHLDSAVEHLKKAIALEASAEAYALLSSTYGRKISLKPLKGMFLGPKAGNALNEAKQLDPDNPRVVLTEAISDFNTPRMWGGSKARAMEGFLRALDVFEQEDVADPLQPSWGHEDAYAWLGIAHLQNDAREAARAAFEKALEINPDYGWVKYVLLPKLNSEAGSE